MNMRRENHSEDASIVAARIKEARERAGYRTTSLKKLTMILDACGVTMTEFLGTDLIIGPRGDSSVEERKLVTMLTRIRALNPSLARVVERTIISAHAEVLELCRQGELRSTAPVGRGSRKQEPR